MKLDSEIRSIAIFFFFALLDDKKAEASASYAVDIIYQILRKNAEIEKSVALVLATHEVWEKNKCNQMRGRPSFTAKTGWNLPLKLNLAPWKEFQKTAPENEFLMILWSCILKIPHRSIAEALHITEGTIRYRVGKGLKRLGSLMNGDHNNNGLRLVNES